MTHVNDDFLDRVFQAIVDDVDPEQVIPFGSRAREEHRENSDIDLIVVEAERLGPERSRHREMVRPYHAVARFPVATDDLVHSHEDVDYWRELCVKKRSSMSDRKISGMLLQVDERDLEALRIMRQSDQITDEIFGFHVQETAEKSLKAWLAFLGEVLPLTHNLELFLDLLGGRGAATVPLRRIGTSTPDGVEFRYAGVESSTEPIDREFAITIIESLLQHVRLVLVEIPGT